MIVNIEYIKTLLGVGIGSADGITDQELAILQLVHPAAEQAVRDHLGYDPEQQVHTERLPRPDHAGGSSLRDRWSLDVNASHTLAVMERTHVGGRFATLQLTNIPIRKVIAVHVDENARFGDAEGAWPDESEWVQGDDFHVEWERADVGRSGCLLAAGSWPTTAGSVRVEYRAGYSPAEFAGLAAADEVAADGTITTRGLNASGIARAVFLTAAKSFNTWQALRKRAAGIQPGTIVSERLGDYSYTLSPSAVDQFGGLITNLPEEAKRELAPYQHYGLQRL